MSDWIKTSDGWKQTSGNGVSASEVTEIKESLTQLDVDLKMLGWTVPSDLSVQNSIDANGVFHQRVDRVDLGSLEWTYNTTSYGQPYFEVANFAYCNCPTDYAEAFVGYCSKYTTGSWNYVVGHTDGMCVVVNRLRIKDANYTDVTSFKNSVKGVYLYFELATEKTYQVDGNEVTSDIKQSLTTLTNDFNNLIQSVTVTVANNNGSRINALKIGNLLFVFGNIIISSSVASGSALLTLNGYKFNGRQDFSIIPFLTNAQTRIHYNIYCANNVSVMTPNGSAIPSGEYFINQTFKII